MNDISSLALCKVLEFCKPFEKFTASNKFRDHVIIFLIFHQINYSNNVWMWFLTQNRQFILKKLDINFLLLYLLFLHDFNSEFFVCCKVFADSYLAESALTDDFTEFISWLYIFPQWLKFLEIIHVKGLFVFHIIILGILPSKVFAYFTHAFTVIQFWL